ncbi:hypothetical protein PENSPDRAFT_647272 [Peniophora sp. CONT]|nr:hypothetical protein PENSPDRAFT_647272 [Peniophora sp. CONT]
MILPKKTQSLMSSPRREPHPRNTFARSRTNSRATLASLASDNSTRERLRSDTVIVAVRAIPHTRPQPSRMRLRAIARLNASTEHTRIPTSSQAFSAAHMSAIRASRNLPHTSSLELSRSWSTDAGIVTEDNTHHTPTGSRTVPHVVPSHVPPAIIRAERLQLRDSARLEEDVIEDTLARTIMDAARVKVVHWLMRLEV